MLPFIRIAALGVFAAATALGSQARANLLTNGSFENTTNFVNQGNDTDELYPNTNSATAMPGWTVFNDDISWIGPTNPFGVTAPSNGGSYFLDLSGYHNGNPDGGLQQTVSTTAGATYLLTFELGSSPQYGIQDGVAVTAGGALGSFATTNDGTQFNLWESEAFSFTASSSTTTISFLGDLGQNYVGLDNVSLVQTSAPVGAPAPLAGAGLLSFFGAGGVAMRKRAKRMIGSLLTRRMATA